MRRGLDALYDGAGWLAALAIAGICVVVTAQVGLNLLARLGGPGWSWTIPSYADFAGFALAAATFLALASTLRHGVHIRVNLLVRRLPRGAALAAEIAVLATGAAMAGLAAWHATGLVAESLRYGDRSTGIVAIPLWIAQIPMVAGLGLLAIACLDTLVEAARRGAPILVEPDAP